jgi:hypothetical protein
MQPHALFRTDDGALHAVPHGGLIGRLQGAALVLPDPRVSEVHAMVSLRGGSLLLLTLRGRFAVDGRTPSSLELAPGQRVQFAKDLGVDVVRVHLPDAVLALRLGDGPPLALSGVTSLVDHPEPRLVTGYKPDARAVFWSQDGAWRMRVRDGADQPLAEGPVDVGALDLACVRMQLRGLDRDATRQLGGVAAPLLLVNHYDSVQLHRDGQPPVTITGNAARIVGELVAFGGPVEWQTLAREIWGDTDAHRLRRNLDQTLLRLRRKLEGGRIRPDLVRADGSGKVELVLGENDRVEDRA